MMTPKELLRIAKNINPEKLASDPQAALEDAYIVYEAFRLAEMEKVSEPNFRVAVEPPEPREIEPYPKQRRSTVDDLRRHYNGGKGVPGRSVGSGTELAEKLGVSSSTVYHWLAGNTKPSVNNIGKIEAYLTDVGYYE